MFKLNNNVRVLFYLIGFFLITPLTIFYVLEGSGVFDTRSSAGQIAELGEKFKQADLDDDNSISLKDFSIWLDNFRKFKNKQNQINLVGDLDSDNNITLMDFSLWLRLWREYKAGNIPTKEEISENIGLNRSVEGFKLIATYKGDSRWKYVVTGTLPNPCYGATVSTKKDLESKIINVTLLITSPSADTVCAQVIKDFEKEGVVNVGKNYDFIFYVQRSESEIINGDESDNKSISMKEGEIVKFTVEYNVTTGYTDFDPQYNPNLMELIGRDVSSVGNGLVGGNTTTVTYYFKAIASSGSSNIILGIHREFDPESTRLIQRTTIINLN
jgi:hypothetical protein